VSARRWHAVDVIAAADAAEAIEHCLNELNAIGTEIDQLRRRADEDITVTGYFEQRPQDETIESALVAALTAFDLSRSVIRSVDVRTVDETDWLSEWKKHWRPTRVGRFVIAPAWEVIDEPREVIVIHIEPNMAFGTGTHETTRLCLAAIDELYRPDMSFLDVGTGTGILAIAAALMRSDGAVAKIRAIDIDSDSIRIARENAQRNGVAELIEFAQGSLDENVERYDFVCANLTLDVITPLLDPLLKLSETTLVLSGILNEQRDEIVRQLRERGIADLAVREDGEWIAVVIER
jgi:ribosomal protein L11 methyltransferase